MSITLNNMSHATIHTYTPQCVHANYVYVYIHTHADPHHPAHMHIKRTCIKLLFFFQSATNLFLNDDFTLELTVIYNAAIQAYTSSDM